MECVQGSRNGVLDLQDPSALSTAWEVSFSGTFYREVLLGCSFARVEGLWEVFIPNLLVGHCLVSHLLKLREHWVFVFGALAGPQGTEAFYLLYWWVCVLWVSVREESMWVLMSVRESMYMCEQVGVCICNFWCVNIYLNMLVCMHECTCVLMYVFTRVGLCECVAMNVCF